MAKSPVERLGRRSRYLILGDLHMGNGGFLDEMTPNRNLLLSVLQRWYLPQGYTMVLNGDIEELSSFWLKDIRAAWTDLYALFDAFAARGSLRKIVGDRDLGLLRKGEYPYPLHHGLSLLHGDRRVFVFHGHQASRPFAKRNYLSDFIQRYLEKPMKLGDTDISTDPSRRRKTERRIYRASRRLGILSVFGHTHRPLFESRSRYESLRSAIRGLLTEYASSARHDGDMVSEMIAMYRRELGRQSSRVEEREPRSRDPNEDGLILPCVFNSGCGTGRRGIDAIEIEDLSISLVHWTTANRARAYIEHAARSKDRLEGTAYARYVLERSSLDSVFDRISLLTRHRH